MKLAEDPDFTTTLDGGADRRRVARAVGPAPATSDAKQLNRLICNFQSGLTVRRRGLTYVLEISYAASNPAKAALISGAVADAYLDDQRAAKADITQRASGWLGERIEAMRSQVRDAERAVADYKSANSMVDVTQGNKLISRQIEDLTQQLALARSRTADAWARLERVEHVTKYTTDPAALAEALQSPVIANLRAQLAETARADAENNALYGNRHPTRIGVRAQLEGIRRQIDNELARIVAGVRNDYKVAGDREKSLESELTNLTAKFAVAGQANVRLHELEREAQATRALFEQFLSRAKETSEQQSLQIADARIVSPALTPLKQDRPPTPVLLIAAVVGGGILGLGLVLVMDIWAAACEAGRKSSGCSRCRASPRCHVAWSRRPPGACWVGVRRTAMRGGGRLTLPPSLSAMPRCQPMPKACACCARACGVCRRPGAARSWSWSRRSRARASRRSPAILR